MLPDPADIGALSEVVRTRREELGLSQNDLAAAVCLIDRPTVTGNDIARWERGKRIPRSGARRALEEALNLPIHFLDRAAAEQRATRDPDSNRLGVLSIDSAAASDAVALIRSAFLDSNAIALDLDEDPPPNPDELEVGLNQVMTAYQSSRFDDVLTATRGSRRRTSS